MRCKKIQFDMDGDIKKTDYLEYRICIGEKIPDIEITLPDKRKSMNTTILIPLNQLLSYEKRIRLLSYKKRMMSINKKINEIKSRIRLTKRIDIFFVIFLLQISDIFYHISSFFRKQSFKILSFGVKCKKK